MIAVTSLWLPILVSAVLVFAASSIVHMVLGYHSSDYHRLPDEEKVLSAMREAGVGPGSYAFPHAPNMKEMGSPEMTEKYRQGPVGIALVQPPGPPAMTSSLVLWFLYSLLVGLFAAYVAGVGLSSAADYLTVFRVTGAVALVGYAGPDLVDSIWKGQPWKVTAKGVFDGLIYALLTAGAFGWLWPD